MTKLKKHTFTFDEYVSYLPYTMPNLLFIGIDDEVIYDKEEISDFSRVQRIAGQWGVEYINRYINEKYEHADYFNILNKTFKEIQLMYFA